MQYQNGTSVGMVGKAKGKPGQKKLSIKPLKVKKLPDSFCENSWNKLQEAVRAVQNKRAVKCSLEELYRTVEDLCYHKLADKVYKKLEEECQHFWSHLSWKLQLCALELFEIIRISRIQKHLVTLLRGLVCF
eukprot:TRINITY_DN15752_c0_g1_i1.p2 TRINITY_DN15752_c0_g1~~TRINITY_DN15752_c0_g1_i1.p2  ORF type:complete len:132 (+),score=13.87 TRINITY_DN15752_c0_g1_i1:250-645(+)